jgi:hypothetical protein
MEQLPLRWTWPTRQLAPAEMPEREGPDVQGEVALDPGTTEAVVAVMERLLVVLVCARKEGNDER